MGSPRKGIIRDIIEYVQAHPGCETVEVFNALPNADKLSTVQHSLGRLAREGVLQNRGGNINRFDPAKWYPNDPFISKKAQVLASDIYTDMMKLHRSVREQFLAEKLDDLLADMRNPKLRGS